jgi:hypothetical protein
MQLRSPFRRSGEGFAVARWDFGLRWRSRPVMVDAGRLCSSRAIPKRVGGVVGDLRVAMTDDKSEALTQVCERVGACLPSRQIRSHTFWSVRSTKSQPR